MSKDRETYRQPYCDNCHGDGASWIRGETQSKTVQDIQSTPKGWLCKVCRFYIIEKGKDQPFKASPIAKALQQARLAA